MSCLDYDSLHIVYIELCLYVHPTEQKKVQTYGEKKLTYEFMGTKDCVILCSRCTPIRHESELWKQGCELDKICAIVK